MNKDRVDSLNRKRKLKEREQEIVNELLSFKATNRKQARDCDELAKEVANDSKKQKKEQSGTNTNEQDTNNTSYCTIM